MGILASDGKLLTVGGKLATADVSGGTTVEPFTKVLTGTVTFADLGQTTWELPETDNLLGGYLIRTNSWDVSEDLESGVAQMMVFAAKQKFGYSTVNNCPVVASVLSYSEKALNYAQPERGPTIEGTTLKLALSNTKYFYGTYWYALIYGSK